MAGISKDWKTGTSPTLEQISLFLERSNASRKEAFSAMTQSNIKFLIFWKIKNRSIIKQKY